MPHATTVPLLCVRSHRDQPALCLPAAGDAEARAARPARAVLRRRERTRRQPCRDPRAHRRARDIGAGVTPIRCCSLQVYGIHRV